MLKLHACAEPPKWEQFTLRLVPDTGMVGSVPEELQVEVTGTQASTCCSWPEQQCQLALRSGSCCVRPSIAACACTA